MDVRSCCFAGNFLMKNIAFPLPSLYKLPDRPVNCPVHSESRNVQSKQRTFWGSTNSRRLLNYRLSLTIKKYIMQHKRTWQQLFLWLFNWLLSFHLTSPTAILVSGLKISFRTVIAQNNLLFLKLFIWLIIGINLFFRCSLSNLIIKNRMVALS